ncbi:hypothetical protein EAX61_01775 [Dokdonia sinensis]|uniref:Outer membrane protein beta-barrel domain-containing protein n=1 Tax=Dokdonia sinensis TaxID=2479847 RepID=A0A3M0GGA8_9FLAO|nr:hypothetical protein [Dokdonia sinensis]RMB64131.1 hypothetical protein EAX61_01775 [Dokdonia sinensis]
MKKVFQFLIIFISAIGLGQEHWAIELRPTLHFPTRKVIDEPLRIGNGIDLIGVYRLGERTDIYTGLIWNRFDTDEGYREDNIEFTQKGIQLGGLVYFNIFQKQKNPFYIRAGMTFMDVKVVSTLTAFNFKTDIAVGTHLGFGMKIVSLGKWHVLPEIRFSNASFNYELNDMNRNLAFGALSITGGLRRRF